MRESLALLGLDERVLEIGRRALRRNLPICGIWAGDHNAALIASLQLGCCAFPEASEPMAEAARIVYSEVPPEGLPTGKPCLRVDSDSVSPDWQSWLSELGFDSGMPG